MTKIKSNSPEKLTLLNLSQLDKLNDEVETITLAGKFTLDINKKFRLTQIQKLIIDFQEAFETVKKETQTVNDINTMLLLYHMCIVKYFTNLGLKNLDTSKKKDVEKLLAVANQLLDSGVFSELMAAFPEEEMKKISDAMEQTKTIGNQFGELFTSIAIAEQEKIDAELAEQETLESVEDGHNESE